MGCFDSDDIDDVLLKCDCTNRHDRFARIQRRHSTVITVNIEGESASTAIFVVVKSILLRQTHLFVECRTDATSAAQRTRLFQIEFFNCQCEKVARAFNFRKCFRCSKVK